MWRNYEINGKVFRVWVGKYSFYASVYDSAGNEHERKIHEDETGKYFSYGGTKVYLENWIRISFDEFIQKLKAENQYVFKYDLVNMILTEGIDKLRFTIPMDVVTGRIFGITMSDGTSFKDKICVIDESRHKLEDTYKIGVHVEDYDETTRYYDDFYLEDFLSMIERGQINISKVV